MPKLNCNCKLAVILILTLSIGNLWAQPIRWNVLLFVSDEHSPHFMSIDSQLPQNISTPNLERLAKQGMVFDKTYVAYPVCAPTRASIITGEYPQTHRQLGNSEYLIEAGPNGKTPSLGLLFRAEGYNTALLGKTHSNVQLWDANPGMLFQGKELFIGFDYRLDAPDDSRHSEVPAHIPSDAIWNKKRDLYRDKYPETHKGQDAPAWQKAVIDATRNHFFSTDALNHASDHKDGVLVFDALEYLDLYATGRTSTGQTGSDFKITNRANPFFLYIGVVKPHWPEESPKMQDGIDFYAMYSGRPEDDDGTYWYKTGMQKKIVPAAITKDELAFNMKEFSAYGGSVHEGKIPLETIRLLRARYSSSVSWVDHLLGKVMDKLEELDDRNNPGKKLSQTTIVAYTTDHGDMMGEKHRLVKLVMQEASARIPFVIRMPGVIPEGKHSNILINHVDMFPTLAGLCGLGPKLRSGLAGKDLSAAVIQNNAALGPERTFSVCKIKSGPTVHPGFVMGRSQKFKLIRFAAKRADGLPYMVLFDMDNDPHETKNLADDPRFADALNRESAAMDTFLLRFGVPPLAIKVGVSTKSSGEPPVSLRN